MIGISPRPIDPVALLAEFQASSAGAGAIVSFIGVVRGSGPDGSVESLWLDHHERLTPAALQSIGDEALRRFALVDITIVHRVGEIEPEQPVVFVAAAASHRREAFEAVDYAMDRVKIEAPFWKRETRCGADYWIEARPSDHSDHERWRVKFER